MPSVKSELTKGVFWIALAKYSGIFISLGITAILARHISPAAFGTMAIATVIMAFLDIFSDLGIGAAIIQFKGLTQRQINSLFMMGAGIGIMLSIGLYCLGVPLYNYYRDAQLIPVCHWLALTVLFNSLNIVPNGLMLRNKRFKVVSLRTLSFQLISGSIAVGGALNGWGIYALIVTPVTTSIGVFFVNYCNYPQRLTLNIDFDALKKVWKYSSFQFLFNLINYFSRNIDKLIIGKYFSMSDLGYYDKSYRLMQLPLQNITFVITPVLHPILSTLKDNKEELADKNTKLAVTLSQISFPLGIILFFCAGNIIEIIFGQAWRPSIPIFKILALSVPLQVILSTSGSVFLASGKSSHLFIAGLINTAVTISGFLIAALCIGTIDSMAWAWDITLLIGFFSTYIFMYRFTFSTSVLCYLKQFLPQVINSAIVVTICLLLVPKMKIDNPLLSLVSISLGIVLLTTGLAYLFGQYNIIEMIKNLIQKIRNKCNQHPII